MFHFYSVVVFFGIYSFIFTDSIYILFLRFFMDIVRIFSSEKKKVKVYLL